MYAQLLAFLNHGVTKGVLIAAILAALGFGAWLWHQNGYNVGYKTGYVQSLKDNPPNIYTGPTTVNQQPCPTPSVFGLSLGKLGLGLIFKR